MDAKSLARSKRAHSQHLNKKHNPSPTSKLPSSSSQTPTPTDSNSKKPPRKQTSSASPLPTNWGRYEDELELDDNNNNNGDDVVLPKSKGADFRHLLSEAQTQLESNRFPSFDDVLPDFDQGISSMLSVRGNGLLSWIENDNFIVGDSSATNTEASFLSLDLHALASKLEKIDVSQRLFIEADLLPPQQDVETLKEALKLESEQKDNRAGGIADGLSSLRISDEERSDQCNRNVLPSTVTNNYSKSQDPFQGAVIPERPRETTSSTTSTSGSSVQSLSVERNILVNQVKDNSTIKIESSVEVASVTRSRMSTVDKSTPAFEALAAEAELDMLLNSLGETDLPKTASVSNKPISHWGDSATTLSRGNMSKQASAKASSSSTSGFKNVGSDDTLDDLLRDTSFTPKPKQVVAVAPHVPASSSKPTAVLDDFDSWLDTI